MSAIYSSILPKVQKLKAEEPVAEVFRQHISPQPSGLGMTLAWHDTLRKALIAGKTSV
jgi:hypothetical protein